MNIHVLDHKNTVLNTFLSELRDQKIQKDRLRFRRNIERIGEILSYEMSQSLTYKSEKVQTPLGSKVVNTPTDRLAICSILRAGLPLHQGILNYFDHAENAFISAYRNYTSENDFEIKVEYLASPNLHDTTLILADPMLATGRSMVSVFEGLKKLGSPKEIHILCVIGSKEGVSYIENKFPENTHLWIATVDDTLNSHDYIVPGLGDAGDLAFGQKL